MDFVISGVTNFNVPGDLNSTTGAITAALYLKNGDFVQSYVDNFFHVGGDPASIAFCAKVGLDYVSASPYRVPIARLAAAQAARTPKGK